MDFVRKYDRIPLNDEHLASWGYNTVFVGYSEYADGTRRKDYDAVKTSLRSKYEYRRTKYDQAEWDKKNAEYLKVQHLGDYKTVRPRPNLPRQFTFWDYVPIVGEIRDIEYSVRNGDQQWMASAAFLAVDIVDAVTPFSEILTWVGSSSLRTARRLSTQAVSRFVGREFVEEVLETGFERGVRNAPGGQRFLSLPPSGHYLDPTDANLNLFAAELRNARGGATNTFLGTADNAIEDVAQHITPHPGFHDIVVHADSERGVFVLCSPQGDIAINPQTLANHVNSLNLPEGQGVRLIACNAGFESAHQAGPARAFQQLVNRPVMVSEYPVSIYKSGENLGTLAIPLEAGRYDNFVPGQWPQNGWYIIGGE